MARYREHTLVQGDTLHRIADYYLGDVQRWQEIAEYNNLEFPFIVDSPSERERNPEGFVTYGDSIIIPVERNILDIDSSNLGPESTDSILELSLGIDLKTLPTKKATTNETDRRTIELVSDGGGDVALAKGRSNIAQALANRLYTQRGSLIDHASYGSDLGSFIGGKTTNTNLMIISQMIARVVREDGRVSAVEMIESYFEGEDYYGEFDVELYSIDEMFRLVVDESNKVIEFN